MLGARQIARRAARIGRRPWLAGGLVVAGCTLLAAWSLDRGWIPHDEGQLGQTAERILQGELPHRDFVEPYTGGLGYLHALAFRLFGVRSEVLRWTLLPLLAAAAGCVYGMCRRIGSPLSAATATCLYTCLTLPVYAAAMPSWYNLFAATLGTAALLRHRDTGLTRWLLAAGLCGGLSMLVKITGLYFVAAAVAWLVYREATRGADAERPAEPGLLGRKVRLGSPFQGDHPIFPEEESGQFPAVGHRFTRFLLSKGAGPTRGAGWPGVWRPASW